MNLLIGTDWVANRDRVLDEVADGVGRGHEGLVLLVPELISHDAERRLCDRAGDTAADMPRCSRLPDWCGACQNGARSPPRNALTTEAG